MPFGGVWHSKPTVYFPEHGETSDNMLDAKKTDVSVVSPTFTKSSSPEIIYSRVEVSIEDNTECKTENDVCNVVEFPSESVIQENTAESPMAGALYGLSDDVVSTVEFSSKDKNEGESENGACDVNETPPKSEVQEKTTDSLMTVAVSLRKPNIGSTASSMDDTESDSGESDIAGTIEPTSYEENVDKSDDICLNSAKMLRKKKTKSLKRLQPQQKQI